MAVRTKDISVKDSIKEQLQEFVLEVGTSFAVSSRKAVERLVPYMNTLSVVDLGCGDGAATQPFHEHGVNVAGVDINVKKLRNNHADALIENDMMSYLKSEPDNSIPNIFCHHALEHVPNPGVILDLVSRKLSPGGLVYIEVPSNDHIHSVHHATFDDPHDLLPRGLVIVEADSDKSEHYLIARKP